MDSKTDSMATLFGGRKLTIYRPELAADENVFVRQLPIKLYEKLRDCLTDECAQVELYCDKPPGWAETLSPKQHEEILGAAEEINRDFFSRWLDRQKAKADMIPKADTSQVMAVLEVMQRSNPEFLDNLMSKVATSQTSSPKSPSRAG